MQKTILQTESRPSRQGRQVEAGNLEPVSIHKSVLLNEVIEGLNIVKGNIILDATVNGGGHSSEIKRRFKDTVTLIGIDADTEALKRAEKNIPGEKILLNYNFRNLDQALLEAKLPQVDRIIFDLGLSSDQLERGNRGFSFQKDEPLVMTLTQETAPNAFTAYDIANKWEAENIEAVIKGYGEEKYARRIANQIVKERALAPIKTSRELAEIIKKAIPAKDRFKRLHPATKTFQALRIAVNDELGALKEGLTKSFDSLSKDGRLGVISFHSLEDRIVKHFMRDKVKESLATAINKKPITGSESEIMENPRSRSAKLRIIEKL